MTEEKSIYQQHWDFYAERGGQSKTGWPGDEWGTEETWQRLFDQLFVKFEVSKWNNCVEVGCGSGKYTRKVLTASDHVRVIAADISPVYQSYCRERLTQEKLVDRVTFVQLDTNPNTLMRSIDTAKLRGKLDAFYSIDAMVHVDLQHLLVYLVTAAVALKPSGNMIMTLANSASDLGFEKLVKDARQMFRKQNEPTAKFEWMSLEMVSDLLPRLGFAIDLLRAGGRFIHVVASKKTEPAANIAAVVA
jgi:SAM-dependent methyltransferase